ncbi:hypothetical protein D9M69_472520 [compost metagenome]
MGDDEDRRPREFQLLQRQRQRTFTDLVQVSIRLIQNDKPRAAIECPGQPDTLTLPTRQIDAPLANDRIVAIGQHQNHFVDTGGPGRQHHFIRINDTKTRDVVADSAFEQFNVLRQIPEVRPQLASVPIGNIGGIQTNDPKLWFPHAHQGLAKRRLARGAWSDNTDHGACRRVETDTFDDRGP